MCRYKKTHGNSPTMFDEYREIVIYGAPQISQSSTGAEALTLTGYKA